MIKVLSFPPLSFYANVALSPFFEKSTQKIWCSQKKRLPLHPQNQRAEQREPLSMLIWQTFYQPLAKKQFPIILQDKTKCGIYKITNIMTDECYIGQSNDIYRRWNDHCKCGLGIDTPAGNKLYQSMIQYGLENFTFELLTECSQSELNEKEKYFIELYQANSFGFNGTGGNK